MEPSADKIEELIARRLLTQAEEMMKRKVPRKAEEAPLQLKHEEQEALVSPDFVKIEKNLTSLGFFTPSSRRIKNEKAKTITFMRVTDGTRVEAKVTIVPAALYGLPVTTDQDKYLALQRIVTDIQQQEGVVKNPIGFTSTELLRLLNQSDAGKNYQDIGEWLDVMTATTIMSEGAVYLAGKKVFAKDRFHIFDRAISVGKEIEPGVIADKNYVWLSEWQLENINNNYLLPIDFDTYKKLKNHIAKALVPLLQIWLYASREEGCFEKRYDELCQILAVRQYKHLSEIKRNFTPSLDELKAHGYITSWKVEKTSDKKAYKVIFYHGEKFHRDRHQRLGRRGEPKAIAAPADQVAALITDEATSRAPLAHPLLAELTKRGITETAARKLLADLPNEQPVLDQLELIDHLITQGPRGSVRNPPGFYLYLLKENIPVPDSFETSRKRKQREESRAEAARAETERLELELAYETYRREELDRYIQTQLPAAEYEEIFAGKRQELLKRFPNFGLGSDSMVDQTAQGMARSEIAKRIVFQTFEDFCEERRRQAQPASLAAE